MLYQVKKDIQKVKDLSIAMKKGNKEFCIMPLSNHPLYKWKIERENGLERNEVFGKYNRQKSIEDGLVIFLTPEQHREGKHAFHKDKDFRQYAEWVGMNAWCEYYKKTKDDFRKRYGFYAIEPENIEEEWRF